jgi:hypothetical protein
MYLNFSAHGKFFPHTFDHFELHIVKITLGITAFGKGLLYFELPTRVRKTWGSHSNNYEDYGLLGSVLCSSACSNISKERTALVFMVQEKVSLLH